MRTRSFIVGLTIVAASLAACTGSTGGGTGGKLEGSWSLTSYSKSGTMTDMPKGVIVDAAFDAAKSTVAGSAGCNRYTGPYTAEGAKLTFGNLTTTMMMCVGPAADIETAYLANLKSSATYTATAETLTIFDAAGASILVYAVEKPGSLDGVTWHATGINNGKNAVVSVVAGTDPTAVFDAVGTVSGDATCNQFNGPATVDGTSIAIGPLMSTKMACADEAANAQEAAYLAALEAATTFEVVGNVLELRDASGALQVGYEAR